MIKRNFIKTLIGAGLFSATNAFSSEEFEDIAEKVKYWLDSKASTKITLRKNEDLYHIINLIHNNEEVGAVRGIAWK